MTRSETMARIKGKNTKPEVYLRKLLWHEGFRYRIHHKALPGSPDIYLAKYKTAIFVNGCFWHMHENCKHSTIPKTNQNFWKEKFARNVARDCRNHKALLDMGINVIVVWGCEIEEMRKVEQYKEDMLSFIKESIMGNLGLT
ncbi:MAG: DNA mismatch endonuclease Vsr [Bacteroidales bacterium]|nr:DNA mismatch endonuclease Vsr [Spirochaetales bacterium]NMB52030.1 DNA mismatch endonuclease Vsr [Bacteroidales bacterium]